jgi:hypothetical protein
MGYRSQQPRERTVPLNPQGLLDISMIHHPERVAAIRARVAAEEQLVRDLKSRTKDEGIRQHLQKAGDCLSELANVFLGSLGKNRGPRATKPFFFQTRSLRCSSP